MLWCESLRSPPRRGPGWPALLRPAGQSHLGLGQTAAARRRARCATHQGARGSHRGRSGTAHEVCWVDQNKGIVRLPIETAKQIALRDLQNPAQARSNLLARVAKAFPPPPPRRRRSPVPTSKSSGLPMTTVSSTADLPRPGAAEVHPLLPGAGSDAVRVRQPVAVHWAAQTCSQRSSSPYSPNFMVGAAWQTYGRIYPAGLTALFYGFALQAGLGVALWLVAPLGRTTLRGPVAAVVATLLWNFAVFSGVLRSSAAAVPGMNCWKCLSLLPQCSSRPLSCWRYVPSPPSRTGSQGICLCPIGSC